MVYVCAPLARCASHHGDVGQGCDVPERLDGRADTRGVVRKSKQEVAEQKRV